MRTETEDALYIQNKTIVELGEEKFRLVAEVDRLKEALIPFANYACDPPCGCHNCKAKEALGL